VKIGAVIVMYLCAFVLGAYLPMTLAVLFRYVLGWWKTATTSLGSIARLILGIAWRIFASLAFLFAILILIGANTDAGEDNDVARVLLFSGFLGSIALFIIGYVHGRWRRTHAGVQTAV
jgi:hypothetical protein